VGRFWNLVFVCCQKSSAVDQALRKSHTYRLRRALKKDVVVEVLYKEIVGVMEDEKKVEVKASLQNSRAHGQIYIVASIHVHTQSVRKQFLVVNFIMK
jgi:hypothetical protein